MRKKQRNRKNILYSILFVSLVLCMLPIRVSAERDEKETRLTLFYHRNDSLFSFYKVADFVEPDDFKLTDVFRDCKEEAAYLKTIEENPEKMNADAWRGMASTLKSCILLHGIEPSFEKRTDEEGRIVIDGIEKGLYLILGQTEEKDNHIYKPIPILVCVPCKDEQGEWTYQPEIIHNKLEIDEKYPEYRVVKIWKDDGNEGKRPKEITVHLYKEKEQEPYDTVVLNENTNWEYTWSELPAGFDWTVAEERIEGYTVRYDMADTLFIIENSYQGDTKPQEPDLPQTGQLWWPIPILSCLGIIMFLIGWMQRMKEED